MRRFRRRHQKLSVSLFPFLAVLICTFGVLIIMLVLTVSEVENESNAASKIDAQKAEQKIEDLQFDLDLATIRAKGLLRMRPILVSRLRDERDKRAHLENEISRIEREALLLANQIRLFDSIQDETESVDDIDLKISQLKEELNSAEAELVQKRSVQSAEASVKYSIVPYQGLGGKNRYPIYIECRKNGLTIQPYGIEIAKSDFAHPISERNPLDAALMAVREYFVRHKLADSKGDPYPLLVVRPDGAESYILARHAMKAWDDEFGYELISADKNLDFGTPDAQLGGELSKTVSESKLLQRRMIASRIGSRQRNSRNKDDVIPAGLVVSSSKAGFVAQAGVGSPDSSKSQTDKENSTQSNTAGFSLNERQETRGTSKNAASPPKNTMSKQDQGPVGVESQCLANSRGANWALPSRTQDAVGYLRPIRLYCSENDIVLQLGPGNRHVAIPFDGSTLSVVEPLVQQVWKRIDSWGVAEIGGYWKPELRITVLAGGEIRFDELQRLMKNSGLKIRDSQ